MEFLALSVLVIDSDPPSATFLTNLLTRHGYTVQTCTSAREGYICALRDRPAVIIIDPARTDMPASEMLRKLRADRRTSTAMLIVLTQFSNAGQMGEIMAAGCDAYLLKSQEALDKIISLLAEYHQRMMSNSSPIALNKKTLGGLLIVFFSAKGGTGTSSLCVNIAHAVGRLNPEQELAVMDLALPIGSLAEIVGYDGNIDLAQAVKQPLNGLDPEFLRRTLPVLKLWDFRLLAGAFDPEAANTLDIARIPVLVNAMRRTFDLTFIDLGSSLPRLGLPLLREADLIVMVTSADPISAVQTRSVWKHLQTKEIVKENVFLLLNRTIGLEGLSKSEVEQVTGLLVQATLPYMGVNLSQANLRHTPILRTQQTDTSSITLERISAQIYNAAYNNRN